MISIANMRR